MDEIAQNLLEHEEDEDDLPNAFEDYGRKLEKREKLKALQHIQRKIAENKRLVD